MQELQGYQDEKMIGINSKLCEKMKQKITNILKVEMDKCSLQRSENLIKAGTKLRASGAKGLMDCIRYISDVIVIMANMSKKNEDNSLVSHLMAEAYCLRALCTREAETKTKEFIGDIEEGLKIWPDQEHPRANGLAILFYVADLLCSEGYLKLHSIVNENIGKRLEGGSLEERVSIFCESRFNHPLCVSPVNDTFIQILATACEQSDQVSLWTSCINSEPLRVGFQQNLSVISPLSFTGEPYDGDDAIQPHITINKVKKAVSDLIGSDTDLSSTNYFLAANIYYDLGERLIAKGSLSEALIYAKESFDWRKEQYKSFFTTNAKKEIIVVHSKFATPSSSFEISSNLDGTRTPWRVMRCYLESLLQVGSIYNLLGDGKKAGTLLRYGKNLSSMLNLSIYSFSFSCELGKLNRKRHKWVDATKELDCAETILEAICKNISCLKCEAVLRVSLKQQRAEISALTILIRKNKWMN